MNIEEINKEIKSLTKRYNQKKRKERYKRPQMRYSLTDKGKQIETVFSQSQNTVLQSMKQYFAENEEPLTLEEVHEISKVKNRSRIFYTRILLYKLRMAGLVR